MERRDGVGTLEFHHPKKNSLPGSLLARIADELDALAADDRVRVVVLRSEGDGPFCAGASFDELQQVDSEQSGKRFFSGFVRLILAIRNCPKFVLARVQGKAVGGGVGLIAAADYALAQRGASVKLSELALGIGPFVVGPCVERKLGLSAFSELAIDTEWRDAEWAHRHGLYNTLVDSPEELDAAVAERSRKLAASSGEAMARLKSVLWEGTEHWAQLLEKRAAISGALVRSRFAIEAIKAAGKR